MVNWAKVWDGAIIGGGANGYLQGLALELAAAGHEISCLSSGTEEVPDAHPLTFVPSQGPISIRRHDDWNSLRIFEVINSPVMAPGIFQMSRPDVESE